MRRGRYIAGFRHLMPVGSNEFDRREKAFGMLDKISARPAFAAALSLVVLTAQGADAYRDCQTHGYRPRPEPLWRSGESFFTDAGLFVLGAAGFYSASIIGSLPSSELLLLPALPLLLLAQGKRAFDRQYLWFYVWVGAWLLGTIIADEYNAIGLFNQAKGTARVAFFALDFVAPGDPAK